MKAFHSSVVIDAPAARIFRLLTDLGRWTEWNTTVDKVEGTVAAGSTVKVYAKISPGRAFPVKVVELVPDERMVWCGGMPLGLFTGSRTFELRSRPDGKVDFRMHEEFAGLMAPLITRSIPDLQPVFDEFAQCLKRAAEQRA